MNKKTLFALWGGLYILCAALGFIPAPAGILKIVLTALAIAFFLPPLALIRSGDRPSLQLVRNLSALWLGLTVALIIGNFLTLTASYLVGNVLYILLAIVSSPMICGGSWVISLFGWAFLLFAASAALKKK